MYSAMANLSVKAVDAALMYRVKLAAMGRRMKLREFVISVLEEATDEHEDAKGSFKGVDGSKGGSSGLGVDEGLLRVRVRGSGEQAKGVRENGGTSVHVPSIAVVSEQRSLPRQEPELRDAEPIEFGDVDFEPGPPEPDYVKEETKLTFDDLGEMKVKIKCWCGKLMRAAQGSDDTMACPIGHQKTLIELRREGKL